MDTKKTDSMTREELYGRAYFGGARVRRTHDGGYLLKFDGEGPGGTSVERWERKSWGLYTLATDAESDDGRK